MIILNKILNTIQIDIQHLLSIYNRKYHDILLNLMGEEAG